MSNLIDTDCFKFNEQKIFAAIRQTISPVHISETRNIIECKDDMLFVWNSVDCNVLCLNWRAANTRNDGSIKFQVSLEVYVYTNKGRDITSLCIYLNFPEDRLLILIKKINLYLPNNYQT